MATCTNSNARGEPSAKTAGSQLLDPASKMDPTKFMQQKDVWMQILSFVGLGHFAYVAGVNRQMKEHYEDWFSTIKGPPDVYYSSMHADFVHRFSGTYSDTFYSAAFSSVSCAVFWNENTKQDHLRLVDRKICRTVAKHGKLEVMKWARQEGYAWDKWTSFAAAAGGNLELFKYAHENGCPWYKATCTNAAANGHLEILKYAHENGCPWNIWTCEDAAKNGHLEVLKYAHLNGCPWD